MLKKSTAFVLITILALALLQSCGNHCDCPNFDKKKTNYRR